MSQLKNLAPQNLDSFRSGTDVDWQQSTLRLCYDTLRILGKRYSGTNTTERK